MSDAAADAAPITEQEILSTYRRMQSEMQGLVQNLTKIDMERNEHRYVVRVVYVFFYSLSDAVFGGNDIVGIGFRR
jgi:hypothetical protein